MVRQDNTIRMRNNLKVKLGILNIYTKMHLRYSVQRIPMTKGAKLLFCKIEKKSKAFSIAGHDSLAKATANIKNEEQT